MPRSLASSLPAACALLLLLAGTALAADPDPEPFVDAAEAFGLPCRDDVVGSDCISSEADLTVETQIGGGHGNFWVVASKIWVDLVDVQSVDAEFMAYLSELVSIALGDDPEAQSWLTSMNDGTTADRDFRSGEWTLTWRMAAERVETGANSYYPPSVRLELRYLPVDVPAASPPSLPTSGAPNPSTADGGVPTGGPSEPPVAALGGGRPSEPFAVSVAEPAEISTDPAVVLQSAGLAALLVFLMPFPSQLFNSTLETHEDEVRRWFRLDRLGAAVGGIGAFWSSWLGVIAFTLLAALLYGFLDPGFGFSLGSLATFVGMLVGIMLVTATFGVPAVLAHRRLGDRPSLKVVPVSLLIGVVCVLMSRLTGFQPGYLYGLLIGLAFARELSAADEGRATAIGAAVMLVVAFAAWLGLGTLPDGDAFGLVVLRTSLAALMVAGLEGVVFGLLPMRFLPGEPLYAWNRVLWGGLLLVGAFAFFHILINPASGYLSDSSRTPLFTVLALLIGFSLVSIAFWAWFRFRRPRSNAPI